MWTLGLALYVTAWVRPFEALDLLALDALSLASTAIMFGLCGIASMLEEGARRDGAVRQQCQSARSRAWFICRCASCSSFAFAFHLWRAVTDSFGNLSGVLDRL